MKIQVLVKHAKVKEGILHENETKDEKRTRLEEERTRRIIGDDDDDMELNFTPENKFMAVFDPKNLEFFYQPYVIDTRNIEEFYPFDAEHTVLVTTYSGNLPVKISWEYWKHIWKELTGESITVIEEKTNLPINLR